MKQAAFYLLCSIFSLITRAQSVPQQLDSALNELSQTGRFNGTVLYAEKGKVLYRKAFGVTGPDGKTALNTHSAFNLASVTKQFIDVCILQLAEKGALSVDDDCRKYLPELPYSNISIRNLMTHVSGIPEYFDVFQRYRGPLDTLDNEGLIKMFAQYKPALDFPTGSEWRYCNTNYALLVSIIERVSKQKIPDYVAEHITKPLKLNDTYIYSDLMRTVPANHVLGFSNVNGTRKLNDLTYLDGVIGDGNLYSSVEDLFTWEQSLYKPSILKKATLDEAFRPVKLNSGKTYPYGFGWFIENDSLGIYWHTGGWAGFINLLYRDTKNKRTLVMLSSGNSVAGNHIAKSILHGEKPSIHPTTLITNVMLIDGTGIPARKAAVRIEGDRISAVGDLQPYPGETVIDGNGKVLSPGFIDSHSHLAGSLEKEPEALAALNQGVTTIVAGQDGDSDPVDTLKAMLKRIPPAINVATYTGQASLREMVMGADQVHRICTPEELLKMKALLAADLDHGSLGLSSGLEYEGAFYSNRDEVIELAKVAAEKNARYISHIRSEDITEADAIDEIIQIGRQAKLPVQISHIKIAMRDDWGTAPALLAQLEQARVEGIDITADCYPYDFWNSTLRVLFPKKDFTSIEGGQYAVDHLFDPDGSVLVRYAPDTNYRGKTIGAIAQLRHETPAQTLLHLVAESEAWRKAHPDAGGVEAIMGKSMKASDVSDLLSWANTNICSDGSNGGHPRGFGSFTRILAKYVREEHAFSLETAIRKMTSLSAEHTGIKDRGIVAPGYFADLVLFDPATVKDNSAIGDSKALSDGIITVWVNGTAVYQDKQSLKKYPGVFVGR